MKEIQKSTWKKKTAISDVTNDKYKMATKKNKNKLKNLGGRLTFLLLEF